MAIQKLSAQAILAYVKLGLSLLSGAKFKNESNFHFTHLHGIVVLRTVLYVHAYIIVYLV